jgi:glyoxylase-like metal-dependent hydrolase (beta-lactamase superfamily II)
MADASPLPIARDLEVEALQEAVRWPNAAPRTALVLAGLLLAGRRVQDGYAYFRESAHARPDQPLLLALEGLFQARLTDRQPPEGRRTWIQEALDKLDRAAAAEPGIPTYFRGLVLADQPADLGTAEAAARDLEWVLANKELFPIGLRRNAYRSLAKAYSALGREQEAGEMLRRSGYPSLDPDVPLFTADYWLTAQDGFHFAPPRLIEPAPGVHVAQGYDFGDFAFVETGDGIVAIDAGTTEAHVRAALADLRRTTDLPIRAVIVTHAHWDHVGGLGALVGPGIQVIAQASHEDELRIVNGTGVSYSYFFGADGTFFGPHNRRPLDLAPDRLVSRSETIAVGGVEIGLIPIRGGETDDGLLVHLPGADLIFTGDMLMPYLGAPFLPEGSIEGLFEAMGLIQRLAPRQLIHGHTSLTEAFPIETFPGLTAALRELYEGILQGIRDGDALTEILQRNAVPAVLQAHPAAVIPFLVMRENAIKRVYHQRTGYWKPDGEGMERFAPREWAAALDLLGGGNEAAFARSAETLVNAGDYALALKLSELGLLSHPTSTALPSLRRRALDRLRERHQHLSPFKFIIYSELAGAELPPVE